MKNKYAIATTSFTLLLILSGFISQYQTEAFNLQLISQFPPSLSLMMPEAKQNRPEQTEIVNHNQFSFNLFSLLVSEDNNQNIFVSPPSVAIALSMLYNGANGQTQVEMNEALGYQGMSWQQVNLANQNLQTSLETSDEKIELTISNSLWARQDIPFSHQFLKNNRTFYNAQITNLDFASPQAVNIINNWVEDKTRGKITRIISEINADDLMFLINAIYFKGIWQTEFDPQLTEEQEFYLPNGQTKSHPLMSRRDKYQYYENEQFQAVSVPYGQGRFSLYVFLPRQDYNLNSFLTQLNSDNWQQWLSEFRQREGTLKMPRFKLEYEVTLNQALKALGMESMFTADKADFSGMTSIEVVVDQVKHKTFVEVNEEGTEAAAVTSIGIQATSVQISPEPFNMVVNRPFFCAIRDNETGTLLFMGAIFEPN